ncbi:Kinesin-like protein kif15 [Dipsacomyces acuminosporus]|nr:Kinesin-like protein kif15 [Dipsacomyces acuminosporus]
MQGYNGTIFAYGQTGSGKTFTMQGARDEFTGPDDELRGIIPRCFEHLFARIAEEEVRSDGRVKYLCKASYIEIYNETIYDLLDPVVRMCPLREDIKKGVFIDNVTEETVQDPNEAYAVFVRGTTNRHVSATSMNRESSRSHSVLLLVIQSLKQMDSGLTEIRESRFNLVDLAGSERQKLANTSGLRLKEAANINKSLSALGKVINALVDVSNGKQRHVNYRDSKLTFLLRDSLGGNSVTFIIANVSPAMSNDVETVSTLRFAQSAKMIRNKAVVNQDMQGNVPQLQAEIHRLKLQISQLKSLVPASATDDGIASEPLAANGGSSGNSASAVALKEHYTTQFLLVLAMRKLQELERQKSRYAETIFRLKESLDRHKREAMQQKMVLKFKKAEIEALQQNAAPAYISNAENSSLREEITALQAALSAQPDTPDLLIENLQLREQIEIYLDSASPSHITNGLPRLNGAVISADEAAASLEALLTTSAHSADLQSAFPIIPDTAEYEALEEKIRQAQHDINDLELQRDRLEFQISSIEEDWQVVSDGAKALANAASDKDAQSTIEGTMDNIVGEQARDTWTTIASLYRCSF